MTVTSTAMSANAHRLADDAGDAGDGEGATSREKKNPVHARAQLPCCEGALVCSADGGLAHGQRWA